MNGSLYWLWKTVDVVWPSAYHKLTMVVLANYVDEEDSCFPGQQAIADRVQVSVRKVRDLLADLEDMGVIVRQFRSTAGRGGRTSDRIFLVRDVVESMPKIEPARSAVSTDRTGTVGPLNRHAGAGEQTSELTRGKPPTSPPPSTTTSPSVVERLFEKIWENYPRKVGRKAALKAFTARLRAKDATPSELALATRNYAQACRGKRSEFIMHGSTFFGPDERWRDYLTAPSAQRPEPSVQLTPEGRVPVRWAD